MARTGRQGRRGGRGRGGGPPLLAALDLGTNNCRLLIATPEKNGDLRIVDSFSRIVRLGEGVSRSGELSEAAMHRTVEALEVCAERIRKHRVRYVRAIATEACRRAANAHLLVARAEAAGIRLSVVSPEEEARLAAAGCAPLIGQAYKGALIFDIGGGSTEAIWMRRPAPDADPAVVHFVSVPQGVMSLAEANGGHEDRASYERLCRDMTERFSAVRAQMDAKGAFDPAVYHLLGTSGTVTTLAAVALGLPRYSRSRVDATWHDTADILRTAGHLATLDLPARAAIGSIGPERADFIVAGCAIFTAIATVWPCARLRVADRGLREGILRELMAEAAA